MNDGDAARRPRRGAATSSTFEDHDNGFGDPPRSHRRAESLDERSGCSWSISPPACGSRPDHVRHVDEEHGSSITVPEFEDASWGIAASTELA
jgi:hypothetical protein